MLLQLNKLPKLEISYLIIGTIGLLCYFLNTFISYTLLLFLTLPFLLILVWVIVYQRRIALWFTVSLMVIVGIDQLANAEYFKSEIVLAAKLYDDRSYMELHLRKNNDFEMISNYMFGEEVFKGKYKRFGNKIIFLDKPYSNEFIPDTTYIMDNKLILRFTKDGTPVTGWSADFDITLNKIQ